MCAATALHHATDAGRYDKLDRFNRITRDQWQGGLLDLGLTYDRNSNITSISAPRVSRASTSVQLMGWADRKFGIDGLDRVSDDDWGTLASGAITLRTFRQDWALSQTGNWSTFRIDGNGDSTWDATDNRTHNNANELLTRSAPSATLAHDAAGNMTDNGRVKLKYDAFGRLVARIDRTDGTTVLSSYRYNGLGYRIIERTGTSGTPTRFIYDDRWRIAATYEGSATTPKKRLVHHNAGLAGMGDSSYIDSVILQDADEAGDSTLESRTYTLQNWRADLAVAAKVGTGGAFVCRGYVVYEAYGKAISYPLNSADFNGDDGVDDADNTAFFAAFQNGDPEADLNLDDAIDDLDITAWNALFQSGVTKEPGAGALSGLLVGYAGYMRDGFDDDLYHVRHRVYDSELGRWTRRDPLGYVDGMSVYEYCAGNMLVHVDFMGTSCGTYIGLQDEATTIRIDIAVPDRPPQPAATENCDHLLKAALLNPAVQLAISRYQSACGSKPLPSFSFVDCNNANEQGAYVICSHRLEICKPNGMCPHESTLPDLIIHELTHAEQACRHGGCGHPYWWSCGDRICSEAEAYCMEPGNKTMCRKRDYRTLCQMVCNSLTFPICAVACEWSCRLLLRNNKCINGAECLTCWIW